MFRTESFGEHEGHAAIRVGDWKLVRLGRGGSWELYNLKSDRTEQHNRAAEHPDRVKELAAEWDAWAQRAHVIPYPQPNAQGNGQPKNNGNKKANTKQKAAA